MNLKKSIEKQHCRKGKINGTTKDGRFWLPCDPVIIRDSGNGWDTLNIACALHLRHFENGKVEALVRLKARCNRNDLAWKQDYPLPALLACNSVEDVVVELKKGIKTMEGRDEDSLQPVELIKECFDEYYNMNLSNALTNLGLSETRPGPDDDDAVCSIM